MTGSKLGEGILGCYICKSAISIGLMQSRRATHLCVGVTQLDGNVTFELVLESNGLDTRDGSDSRRFTVGDVSNGT